MSYEIQQKDGHFEVRVWGATSQHEILHAIGELAEEDPGKTQADLWLIAEESEGAYTDFFEIVAGVQKLCPPGMAGNRTAIVAASASQEARLKLYQAEAAVLPWEMRVFQSHDDALRWLKNPSAQRLGAAR